MLAVSSSGYYTDRCDGVYLAAHQSKAVSIWLGETILRLTAFSVLEH